ncbi:hypothetical protein [Sphingobacterium pedocola]|uniref:Uncharacterized protein n=1 Tax=Sphingobacterium pedocola TaxID=2082722 RepID=A0ABR9T783_9SPHI|nr:hypothetical protein [Sphingobacterium pedocola]MBE8721217.1 hypothetical protein [Sphingobacterium pedocola]
MTTNSEETIRYSLFYRRLLIITLIILITTLGFTIQPFLMTMDQDEVAKMYWLSAILGLGVLIFIVSRYTYYVFRWKAILNPSGLTIYDVRRGTLSYLWSDDGIGIELFNLSMLKADYSVKNQATLRTDYVLSKWIVGHHAIVDSNTEFVRNRKFKHIKNTQAELNKMIDASLQEYRDFLNIHRGNWLYLGYLSTNVMTTIVVASVFVSSLYFKTWIAAVVCIVVALQLHLATRYLHWYRGWKAEGIFAKICLSVFCFSLLLFQNVRTTDELFFWLWGLALGALGLLVGKVFVARILYVDFEFFRGKKYLVVFLLFTFFSSSFVKVCNIIGPQRTHKWEQSTACCGGEVILPLVNSHVVNFDDGKWGTRYMNMHLFSQEHADTTSARVEVKTFAGSLGVAWMYSNYYKEDAYYARLIE